MTVEELRSHTRKDLAGMAKTRGVAGWHAMRKDELVKALSRLVRNDRRRNGASRRSTAPSKKTAKMPRNGAANGKDVRQRASRAGSLPGHRQNGAAKPVNGTAASSLSRNPDMNSARTDQLFVVAHDAYWLHVLWELCPATIRRAEAGLGIEWHNAQPVIRVLDVSADENRRCIEKVVKDVPIHGDINHWYIEVTDPPGVYQLQIGYLTASGRFFGLARSNIVQTPAPGHCGVMDENQNGSGKSAAAANGKSNGHHNGDANGGLREMFDRQLRRPMSSHPLTNFFAGSNGDEHDGELRLDVNVEMVVFGNATPGAHLTVCEEPVDLSEDGSFTIRLSLPEGRQVVPATVTSPGGGKQQTVVLAVERNTKQLEVRHFDEHDA